MRPETIAIHSGFQSDPATKSYHGLVYAERFGRAALGQELRAAE